VAEAAKRAKQPAARKTTRRGAGERAGRTLRVKQVKSGIGHAETYRRTLRALGIRHHQHEIIVNDTPSVRGMLHKVRHLVRVTGEA
jgi:large subunit ribosomal protein L30